jgi:fructose-bisphosphate aldolase, class II
MIHKKKLIEVFREAKKEGRAVGQFNFSSFEQLKGIVKAAKETNFPVICGTSPGESRYFGIEEAVSLVRTMEKKEDVSLFLNYDHGKEIEILKKAVDLGYDMVHFDGSHLEIEENIKIAKELVSYAEEKDVLVEGEVSKIVGKSVVSDDEIEDITLTPIEKVVKFVKESGVDCIAFDVGSFHGVHKTSPKICPNRVEELLKEIEIFVVLHGGSGIENEDIADLIEKGMVKINVNTEIRLEWRNTLYNNLSSNEKEIVPYNVLPTVVEAVSEKVKEKINLFNHEKNNF